MFFKKTKKIKELTAQLDQIRQDYGSVYKHWQHEQAENKLLKAKVIHLERVNELLVEKPIIVRDKKTGRFVKINNK